jgi:hypothetical protein
MRILKIVLICIALVSGLASAFLCFWWSLVIFPSLFVHWGLSNPIDEALAAYSNSNFKLLAHIFRTYFAAIAGLPGWIALFALCFYASRDKHTLPIWVPVGCLFGLAAVLAGPYFWGLAIPPISLAISLLLLIKVKAKTASGIDIGSLKTRWKTP